MHPSIHNIYFKMSQMYFLDQTRQIGRICTFIAALIICGHTQTIAQDDGEIDQYFDRIIDKVSAVESNINSNAQRINYLESLLKEDLSDLKTKEAKDERNVLKQRIAKIKPLNKKAKKLRKAAEKRVITITKINNLAQEARYEQVDDVKAMMDDLSEINKQLAELADLAIAPMEEIESDTKVDDAQKDLNTESEKKEIPEETPETKETAQQPSETTEPQKKYTKYNTKTDVLLNPPVSECAELINDLDPFTGKERRMTQSEELFHFTNPYMRNNLKGKQHITCSAEVVETRKRTFLFLRFVINDPNGARNFGAIRNDVPLVIKFVNETKVTLINVLTDEGQMDASGQVYTVNASLELWKIERTPLTNLEIDRIRIPWAKGFEEYEVYRVDLVKRLLRCM
jgi:hypothetical protein